MTINPNITIFGGTGDLTFRKLLPALYTMYVAGPSVLPVISCGE